MMDEKKLIKKKHKAVESGNVDLIAKAAVSLGEFYNDCGKYKHALKEFKEAADKFKSMQKDMETATAHRMIGEMHLLLNEFDEALRHATLYLNTAKKLEDRVEQQRAFTTIGRIHLLRSQYTTTDESDVDSKSLRSAEKYFIKSLLLTKELTISEVEKRDMQARLYLNLGITKENVGDIVEAMDYFQKSIRISQANDFFELLHKSYMAVAGLFHCKQKDSTNALKHYNLALDVASRLPDRNDKICESLNAKGEVLIKMADFQSAKKVLQRSYKLKSKNQNDRENTESLLRVVAALCYTEDSLIKTDTADYALCKKLYEKMGDGCAKLENYPKAIVFYLKMLENSQLNNDTGKDLIASYVSLYQTYKDNEQYDLALIYLFKELQLEENEPKESFDTLMNIAEIYEIQKKRYWDIIKTYETAREYAQKLFDKKLEKIAVAKIVEIYKREGLESLAKTIQNEAEMSGVNLNKENDDATDNDTEEQNTPDIGDDICLDELSDSSNELDDVDSTEKRPTRKRQTCSRFVVKKNNKGETPLHQACISGNSVAVQRLLDSGHPVFCRDNAGWLPIHEACNNGHKDVVEMLLKRDGNSHINDKGGLNCDGITPLYDACANGHLEVLEVLLKYGANPTVQTDFGETPLDALNKWKSSAELDDEEQIFYDRIRGILINKLNAAGVTIQTPLDTLSDNEEFSNVASSSHRRNFAKKSSRENPLEETANNNNFGNENENYDYILSLDYHSPTKVATSPAKSNKFGNQAKQEYKQVMSNLRGRNKQPLTTTMSSASKDNIGKKAALLKPNEVEIDSWLDVDVGPSKKKQKLINHNSFDEESISKPKTIAPRYAQPTSTSNLDHLVYDKDDYIVDESSRDAFEVLMDSNNSRSSSVASTTSKKRRSSQTKSNESKQQNSLFDLGVYRNEGQTRIGSLEYIAADSTNSCGNTSIISSSVSPMKNQTGNVVAVKVKVEDDMFVVPIDFECNGARNIKWLAEETAQRYYKINGIRPVLQLCTYDGAFLEESDPISLALSGSYNLTSTVLDWKISPIKERYISVCAQLKCDIEKDLIAALDQCDDSHVLNFRGYMLMAKHVQPIFRSLANDKNIMSIDISNNEISNEGVEYLAKVTPSLKKLLKLDLSGNFIQFDGIRYFSVENTAPLINLVELNLSFNPLGDEGAKCLSIILENITCLKKLGLSCCDIRNISSGQLKLRNLQSFDISLNKELSSTSIRRCLSELNAFTIEDLNFSFTPPYAEFSENLSTFFSVGSRTILNDLNFVACKLNDSDIYKLLQSLSNYQSIQRLKLAQNNLSWLSLKYIFNSSLPIINVDLTQCSEILKNIDEHIDDIIGEDFVKYPQNLFISVSKDNKENEKVFIDRLFKKSWNYTTRQKNMVWEIKSCTNN